MADIVTDESSTLIASNKVEGTAVYDRTGERLGSIYNFMVGKATGQVEYALLHFGGLFGLGGDYYPIPWRKLTYDTARGGYVVSIDRAQFETAPRYAEGEAFDDSLGERVRSHYAPAPFI